MPRKNVTAGYPARATIKVQGRRIGALRDMLGWSNKEMAEQTGVPEATLSQYIHGRKVTISAYHFMRIAVATGVTTDYLIYGERRGLPPDIKKTQLLPESDA